MCETPSQKQQVASCNARDTFTKTAKTKVIPISSKTMERFVGVLDVKKVKLSDQEMQPTRGVVKTFAIFSHKRQKGTQNRVRKQGRQECVQLSICSGKSTLARAWFHMISRTNAMKNRCVETQSNAWIPSFAK